MGYQESVIKIENEEEGLERAKKLDLFNVYPYAIVISKWHIHEHPPGTMFLYLSGARFRQPTREGYIHIEEIFGWESDDPDDLTNCFDILPPSPEFLAIQEKDVL
ncbi:MAG: hypothetical protein LBN08_00120 [Lactobacillales bacterium]|jgi:hypothetical protein|nr:hypothetical protein [Lactobacillales bacterium]